MKLLGKKQEGRKRCKDKVGGRRYGCCRTREKKIIVSSLPPSKGRKQSPTSLNLVNDLILGIRRPVSLSRSINQMLPEA